MRKRVYFDRFWGHDWPSLQQLEPYFLAPKGKEWFSTRGNDSASLRIDDLHGTARFEPRTGRVDVSLRMVGNRDHGVVLGYLKWDGREKRRFEYSSKGDLARLQECVAGLRGRPLPVGLFIPFAEAWKAVKEFIETDGDLPTSIAWVANRDLPPDTFPGP